MIFQPRLFDAVEQTARGAILMARVLDGLEIFVDRMAELSAANFSQATDLADQLSIRSGLAFRTTHRIEARCAKIYIRSGGRERTSQSDELNFPQGNTSNDSPVQH